MLTYPMAVARSPWRPTAWRYQRGLELSTESRGAKLRSADDRPTRRTFLFLRAQSRAGNNEVALERLRNEYPEVSEAYTLFSDLETRPYVEARLLTREPLTR